MVSRANGFRSMWRGWVTKETEASIEVGVMEHFHSRQVRMHSGQHTYTQTHTHAHTHTHTHTHIAEHTHRGRGDVAARRCSVNHGADSVPPRHSETNGPNLTPSSRS